MTDQIDIYNNIEINIKNLEDNPKQDFKKLDKVLENIYSTNHYKNLKVRPRTFCFQKFQDKEFKAVYDYFNKCLKLDDSRISQLATYSFNLSKSDLYKSINTIDQKINPTSHSASNLYLSSKKFCNNQAEIKENNDNCHISDSDSNLVLAPSLLEFRTGDEILKMRQNTSNLKNVYTNKDINFMEEKNSHLSKLSNKRKNLGTTLSRTVKSKFVPPFLGRDASPKSNLDEKVKEKDGKNTNVDAQLMEMIENEIIEHNLNITWDDVAGLDFVKSVIKEIIVWPMLRPDIFTGLRKPPRGVLLFGPPGTGKTLIGKCIASTSRATFFNISASVLTSKWIGEGEKSVRALFEVARLRQPSVIFIDEVDSLLTSRSTQGEHEASRRLKTEFLVRLDGVTSTLGDTNPDRILVLGATNRPQELDEAARRRFVKRLYVPLPDHVARLKIISNLLFNHKHSLSDEQLQDLSGTMTEGYSGADMADLCREASLGPIRTLPVDSIETFDLAEMRPIAFEDFERGLKRVRPSVSTCDLESYIKWNLTYGCQ